MLPHALPVAWRYGLGGAVQPSKLSSSSQMIFLLGKSNFGLVWGVFLGGVGWVGVCFKLLLYNYRHPWSWKEKE